MSRKSLGWGRRPLSARERAKQLWSPRDPSHTPLLVAHVLIAVLGLGSIASVAIVSTTARRVGRDSTGALPWLGPLLRYGAFSLAAVLATGVHAGGIRGERRRARRGNRTQRRPGFRNTRAKRTARARPLRRERTVRCGPARRRGWSRSSRLLPRGCRTPAILGAARRRAQDRTLKSFKQPG